jgi:hypothetical protein
MMKAYLNHPNSKVRAHYDLSCRQFQKMAKSNQRLVRINAGSISAELQRFIMQQHNFAPNADENDMWIELDFADAEFELALLGYLLQLVGNRYKRLAAITIERHC